MPATKAFSCVKLLIKLPVIWRLCVGVSGAKHCYMCQIVTGTPFGNTVDEVDD